MTTQMQMDLLNDLISKNRDAEKGYEEAMKHVNNLKLRNIFKDMSHQRFRFRSGLEVALQKLSGEKEKAKTFAGTMHRAWMDLRSAIASNEEEAILNEILRGESFALDAYEEAVKSLPISAPYYKTIIDQRNAIRSAIDRMKALEIFSEIEIG